MNKRIPLEDFYCHYIFGYAKWPFIASNETEAFNGLFNHLIIGNSAIVINKPFHPYQIINKNGTSIWQAAYAKVALNKSSEEVFSSIRNNEQRIILDISSSFSDVNVWPDKRIEQPIKTNAISPFILPFLSLQNTTTIESKPENQSLEILSMLLTFLFQERPKVLGVDIFSESNPSILIDHFFNTTANST